MTAHFNMHEAKTQLSRLIAMAEAGDEVVIARDGKPVVRLVPIAPLAPQRRFGALAGLISVDDAFFDPLPEDEIARWE